MAFLKTVFLDQRHWIAVGAALVFVFWRSPLLAFAAAFVVAAVLMEVHRRLYARGAAAEAMPDSSLPPTCPGCGTASARDLRKHMKRCCPEKLPERSIAVAKVVREAREAASAEDWITEEEVRAAAVRSIDEVKNPLHRRVLDLRFGRDRGGSRRTPAEVGKELGKTPETALNLIRMALRSLPLVADDPSSLEILYEDASLLAVSKPPFLRTTPVHRFVGKSLTNQVIGYHRRQQAALRAAGAVDDVADSPMLLHRLDQTTSGVVICGKNKAAVRSLQDQWHGPACRKEYLALARAESPDSKLCAVGDHVLVEAPIGKDPKADVTEMLRRAVSWEEGLSAATRFEVLAVGDASSQDGGNGQLMLLSCVLEESGRTHQIRVHAGFIGTPLVGDNLYGRCNGQPRASTNLGRVALHAWRMTVPHPSTQKPLLIEAPFPSDLRAYAESEGLRWKGESR